MQYPSLEQYNLALHSPKIAFKKNILADGDVERTGLGTPRTLCGGFALTFVMTVAGRKYAVRCFHKSADNRELRYKAIHQRLKAMNSSHFVGFEFLPDGVMVNGKDYPVVKMDWAAGETLGEFVEANRANRERMSNLIDALSNLAGYLESAGIAHGDIQPGNLMVSDLGKRVQLIDYDGLYLPELAALGGEEHGHRNFQHPERDGSQFDPFLDRFSFICLNLALRALRADPSLWSKTRCEADAFVFNANDMADPDNSDTFKLVSATPGFNVDTRNFALICLARYEDVPSLKNFLAGQNIPRAEATQAPSESNKGYIFQYKVLDATASVRFDEFVASSKTSEMIELIGRIESVSELNHPDKPHSLFVHFGKWQPGHRCIKLTAWSDVIRRLNPKPEKSWKGSWVSVKGILSTFTRDGYNHVGITVEQSNQITPLTPEEAAYRLRPTTYRPRKKQNAQLKPGTNTALLKKANVLPEHTERLGANSTPPLKPAPQSPRALHTLNQAIAQKITQATAAMQGASQEAANMSPVAGHPAVTPPVMPQATPRPIPIAQPRTSAPPRTYKYIQAKTDPMGGPSNLYRLGIAAIFFIAAALLWKLL